MDRRDKRDRAFQRHMKILTWVTYGIIGLAVVVVALGLLLDSMLYSP